MRKQQPSEQQAPAVLDRFCFAHSELFVIPVDELDETGISGRFAEVITRERSLGAGLIELFNRAYAAYWKRAGELYQRAPDAWFPPRLQNLCIATDPAAARPYHQPFYKASWLLYASDFDPDVSGLEFATYQLLHAERLGTSGDIAKAIIGAMSYWLVRSEAEVDSFCRDARRATRPDAEVFERLADALPWVRRLYHPSLRPPPDTPNEVIHPVKEAAILVPESVRASLQALVPPLREATARVLREHAEATMRMRTPRGTSTQADEIGEWLRERRPPIVIEDGEGWTLWDRATPDDLQDLRRSLEGTRDPIAESLRADLQVVAHYTERFLESLRWPDRLPRSTDEVDRQGGVYLQDERRLIVYCLTQPGLDARTEVAPAYHRMLLAARTIHEWGHLAEAAGWIAVPESRRDEWRQAQEEVATAVEILLAATPPPFQQGARSEAGALMQTPGRLLTERVLSRMSDYLSNLLAKRYLDPIELEAYVRANVHAHFDEGLTPLQLLGRHAYEYQYLRLGITLDPMRYFLESTWFGTYFVDTGVIVREHLMGLFDAVGRLCDCYEIDDAAFVSP